MKTNILFQALTKYILGLVILAILLFLPAGTIAYWQAWLFIAVLFIPMLMMGIGLMIYNPELLRKRLDAKEKEGEQKSMVAMCSILFVAVFVIAGLNYRFGWCILYDWLVIVAAVVFLIGYVLYAEVVRENNWLSRTIQVQQDQQVVDTGLYGFVRHPMYSATLILFLSTPIVLASPWSFALMLLYIPLIVKRIRNEEEVLDQQLNGYQDYKKRVTYRLIPFIW